MNWDRGCDTACVQNLVLYASPSGPQGGRSADHLRLPGISAGNVVVALPAVNDPNSRLAVTVRNYRLQTFTPFVRWRGSITMRPITATAPIEVPN